MLPTSFLTRRRVMSLGLASAAAPVVATMFGVSAEAQDFGPASGKIGVIGGRDEKVLFPGPGLPGGGQTEIRMVQSIYTSWKWRRGSSPTTWSRGLPNGRASPRRTNAWRTGTQWRA